MPTATGDLAYTPFNHQHPFPPDLRMQRDTLNDRDVISAPIRWEGMLVYVLENQTTYQLRGGLTNEYWAVFVGGGGGDVSNSVLYTIQSLTPAQQLQARLNIGAGELMDGLISLGPVTSLVNDVTIDSVLARINGTNVGTDTPTTINVPVPTAGNTRRDLIVIDGSGLIYLVQGTEVLESQTAITPNVPADTVVLVETFSNDTGLQDVYDFAYSAFVRFDINSQGLSPLQRLNARTNIQAVSKDTDDIRTGFLRQEGLLTVIGDYRQEVENGTSSTNAWSFINPYGGGASFRRSGGLTVISDGDSMTDYLIFRGFDNNGAEVFRVRQGGVTKGGDAINLDDFATLGQVQGLIDTSEQTGVTEFSGDDFFTGYRIDGATRVPQIFDKTDKDIIVTDTGNIILNPTTQVANFIFTGNDTAGVTELRGIESALDGREIHLTNRTGSDFLIIDKYVGGPLNSAFNFGGTNYTFANGSTVSFIGDGTYWNPSVVNEVAFSDNLDSVNSTISVGHDNLEVINNVDDFFIGKSVNYKEYIGPSVTVDGIKYKQIGSKIYKRVGNELDVREFGAKGNWNGTTGTDDTTAFQKAITSLEPYDTLLIPSRPGYVIDGELNFNIGNIDIYGRQSKIIQQLSNAKTFKLNSVSDVNITGLNFTGKGTEHTGALTSYTNVAGIFLTDCQHINIFQNKFFNHAGGSIRWTGTVNDFTILNNYIKGIGASGGIVAGDNSNDIAIGSISSLADNDIIILSNNISSHCFGIYLARGTNAIIGKNNIHDIPGQHGTYFSSQSMSNIEGNIFRNIAYEAIKNQISSPDTVVTDLSIVNNTINVAGQSGIMASATAESTNSYYDRISVENNKIYNIGNYGVIFEKAKNANVSSNKINTTGAYGIYWNEGEGSITDNRILNTNWNAIYSEITNDSDISGNIITDAILNTAGDTAQARNQFYIYAVKGSTATVTKPSLTFTNNIFRLKGTSPTNFSKVVRTGTNIDVFWDGGNKNLTGKGWQFGTAGELKYMDFGYSPNVDFTATANLSPTTPVYGRGRRVLYGTQNPSVAGMTDTFRAGDFCFNVNAGTAPLIGWKCTVGGTPGTWVEADLLDATMTVKGKAKIATQTLTNEGINDTDIVTPLKLAESTSIVGLRGVNLTADGSLLVGTVKPGSISLYGYITPGSTNYPTSNGEVRTFNGSVLERTFSIAKDRDTDNLYVQSYDSSGVGLGWTHINPESPTVISSSVVLDFPVIASDANTTLTATVTGAALLDNVSVAGPADIYNAGGRIDGWVSNTDTVTVRVKNDGGTSIDPTSGTYKIKVFK